MSFTVVVKTGRYRARHVHEEHFHLKKMSPQQLENSRANNIETQAQGWIEFKIGTQTFSVRTQGKKSPKIQVILPNLICKEI